MIWSVLESDKRESILRAAGRAFARLGFKKASIGAIAKSAGVGKGTVYLAAKSKEDLFYQAILRDIRSWMAESAKLVDPRMPADELLVRCTVESVRFLEDHPLVSDLITGIYHGELPGWEDKFEQLRSLGHANIVEILRLGTRQGIFRADIDVGNTAAMLQDIFHSGYIFHHRSRRLDKKELFLRLEAALDLLINGLRRRE